MRLFFVDEDPSLMSRFAMFVTRDGEQWNYSLQKIPKLD